MSFAGITQHHDMIRSLLISFSIAIIAIIIWTCITRSTVIYKLLGPIQSDIVMINSVNVF